METKTTADISLTQATSDLMTKIEKANVRARNVGLATLVLVTVLVGLGVVGIYKQNQLASDNKKHIDCIIKDLATPPPKGTPPDARKYITNLETDCNIQFTE